RRPGPGPPPPRPPPQPRHDRKKLNAKSPPRRRGGRGAFFLGFVAGPAPRWPGHVQKNLRGLRASAVDLKPLLLFGWSLLLGGRNGFLLRGDVDLVVAREGALEVLDPLPQGIPQLRQLARAEDQEDDHEDEQQLAEAQVHRSGTLARRCCPRTSPAPAGR